MPTLSKQQFDRITVIAKERWGLSLTPNKYDLVSNRLSSFLRKSPYSGIAEYLDHLDDGASEEELLEFFDLLSTNVTSFFRDRSHFDYLERELLTGLERGNLTLPGKKLRFWSAGCSTGCEPYTMAITILEHLPSAAKWDIRILATDLSNWAVSEARAGLYDAQAVKDVPPDLLRKYFTRQGAQYAVKPELKALVKVARLNLMADWPISGPFDVIFCRNVMIYFDAPTRERLVGRFVGLLRPGGIFAVGSAETTAGMNVPLRPILPSLYMK